MSSGRSVALFQVALVVICSIGVWQYSIQDEELEQKGSIVITDSNGIEHRFEDYPERIVITNTYAGKSANTLTPPALSIRSVHWDVPVNTTGSLVRDA